MVSLLTCPKPRSEVIAREVDGELLLLDRDGGQLHKLNTSASFIWRGCNGESTVADIAMALAREYGLTQTRAEQDVVETIGKLAELGVVVIGP